MSADPRKTASDYMLELACECSTLAGQAQDLLDEFLKRPTDSYTAADLVHLNEMRVAACRIQGLMSTVYFDMCRIVNDKEREALIDAMSVTTTHTSGR